MEFFSMGTGIVGLGVALFLFLYVRRFPSGNQKMQEIARAIHKGANTFLLTEYRVLSGFILVVFALLAWQITIQTAIAFLGGALLSLTAGFLGMQSATMANVRTTQAAQSQGQGQALIVSFFGGSVMGLAVASCGLIGLAFFFWLFGMAETAPAINGFAMGASSIALFARVGGGIFTKAADVGADLVGKVEKGIPEDDPRNPAVIADNVGDNVGDIAGMGADIFESYVGSAVATLVIGATLPSLSASREAALMLPFILLSLGLLSSFLGIGSVQFLKRYSPSFALFTAPLIASLVLFGTAFFAVRALNFEIRAYNGDLYPALGPFWAMVLGSLSGIVIGYATKYYTSGKAT